MMHRTWAWVALLIGLGSAGAFAESGAGREAPTASHAKGTFEVKLTPQPAVPGFEDSLLGRMVVTKELKGDLAGTSKGQMLTAMTAVQGSAGYVAFERVTGTLAGRTGSFVLQHTGTMAHGKQALSITVVPDSGTGALTGIAGSMTITITADQHAYDFEYTLPATSGP
jgi:hypothetical protein